MGLLRSKDTRTEALSLQIAELTQAVAGLTGLREHLAESNTYNEEIAALSKEKTLLETEIAQQKEDHEREMREIEHKVGLHRTQVEAEIEIAKKQAVAEGDLAVKQAKLEVASDNLTAERERFEQELTFRTERFESEMKTVKDLSQQVLDRLPRFDKSHVTHEYVGTPPNGTQQQIEA